MSRAIEKIWVNTDAETMDAVFFEGSVVHVEGSNSVSTFLSSGLGVVCQYNRKE
jgi:hypothetical protein